MITANGIPTARGELLYPLTGLWRADLVLARAAAEAPVAVGDTLSIDLGGTTYAGTAVQAGPERGLWRVVVLPGKARLSQPVKPKTYQGMDALGILKDTLGEVGEALDDASSLTAAPDAWVRFAGPAYGAVAALVRAAGGAWRATPAGAIWVGVDAWPSYKPATPVLEEAPGRVVLGLDAGVMPGLTLEGYGRVVEVRHVWGPGRARTEVRYDPA